MTTKKVVLRNSLILSGYLLCVWSLYRLLFNLPDAVEEMLVKPILWLLPVYYFLLIEKADLVSLGISSKNIFKSIYLAMALGVGFALLGLIANIVKHKGIDFSANIGDSTFINAFVLSLFTATTEEVTFRGYLYTRACQIFKNEWQANFATSILWGLVHIPISMYLWQLGIAQGLIYILLTVFFGIGSAFIFSKTKNIFSSILLHIFWEWPIILFR